MCPVLGYFAGIRSLRNISLCKSKMHKYASELDIVGDVIWDSCEARWRMAQFLNWIFDMEESRLTRTFIIWDKQMIGSWSDDVR